MQYVVAASARLSTHADVLLIWCYLAVPTCLLARSEEGAQHLRRSQHLRPPHTHLMVFAPAGEYRGVLLYARQTGV